MSLPNYVINDCDITVTSEFKSQIEVNSESQERMSNV